MRAANNDLIHLLNKPGHDGRVVFIAKFPESVYVLHAFQKKDTEDPEKGHCPCAGKEKYAMIQPYENVFAALKEDSATSLETESDSVFSGSITPPPACIPGLW